LTEIRITVAIPTLAADSALAECLDSLSAQAAHGVEVVVVDNSGQGLVRKKGLAGGSVRVIENGRNVGYGAAINAVYRASGAPFVVALNDDAVVGPGWAEALLEAVERDPGVGMCASRILLSGTGALDSAGMSIARDASSKQRGHGLAASTFAAKEDVLFPSGCAALYRRAMLDEIGGFDEDFFLYCEDTDLGLRAQWAGWRCVYVPEAVVEHRYSHSAGRASAMKAYYVERNRLFVLVKNYPARLVPGALLATVARYFWHTWFLLGRRGTAAKYRHDGGSAFGLVWFTVRAHWGVVANWRSLYRKRRGILDRARIGSREFTALLGRHAITVKEVAAI
jgi:GT2 family glycosyltransferase